MKDKAFCCLSGGKDSIMSFYRAVKSGVDVKCFLNMATEDGLRSRSHGLSSCCLSAQAGAIGLPLVRGRASWDGYEAEFKKIISGMKDRGLNTGIFGDIDLDVHREWVERVCAETGIKPVLPLWLMKRDELMKEFVDSGFEAVVCSLNTDMMGEEWLGRRVDAGFVKELTARGDIDLCGEKGEYHTFVYNGPVFKRPLKLDIGEKRPRKNGVFLEIRAE
ncbi:MAG: diphthine--ammonia ligase [Elusimicrobia bacterium]|nr:diphthine--ammonia ligase [Elusimicrobiota bacterium]